MELSHYAELGVAKDATQEEIKAAWRKAARMYHPDMNPDPAAHEKYKNVAAAYDVLWHPMSRRIYDMQLGLKDQCARCGGAGTVTKQRGFHGRVSAPCPECVK